MFTSQDFAPGCKSNELPNIPTNCPKNQRTSQYSNELTHKSNEPAQYSNELTHKSNELREQSNEPKSRKNRINTKKAGKYWSFWQKEKYSDSIKIRVLLCVRTPVIIQFGVSYLQAGVGAKWVQIMYTACAHLFCRIHPVGRCEQNTALV